jgi:hypothetical protein
MLLSSPSHSSLVSRSLLFTVCLRIGALSLVTADAALSLSNGEAVVEELRRSQNVELLDILKEEQRKESERESFLASVPDPSERRRLEKIFGVERAKASDRIMRITADHEAQLTQKLREFNMLPT